MIITIVWSKTNWIADPINVDKDWVTIVVESVGPRSRGQRVKTTSVMSLLNALFALKCWQTIESLNYGLNRTTPRDHCWSLLRLLTTAD